MVTQAQQLSLSTFPDKICFKDFTNTSITINNLPLGVTVDSVFIDYNSDSIPEVKLAGPTTVFGNFYKYTAPGSYQITAKVKLSNGARITQTYACKVHTLPTAGFTIMNAHIQCFRNNRFILKSTATPGDHKIVREIWVWGDATTEDVYLPTPNQIVTKSYSFSNKFLITQQVVDSLGCESEVMSIPNTPNELTVLNNLSPEFNVFGSRGCYASTWLFDNVTLNVTLSRLKNYKWIFGDGSEYTAAKPWNLPNDLRNYDSISHVYTASGTFYPSLIVEDTSGCRDTFSLTQESTIVPKNVSPIFDITPTLNKQDTFKRFDSACFAGNGTTIYFKQTPIDFSGNGSFLWNFGDAHGGGQQGTNNRDWWPSYTYKNPGKYIVRLSINGPCDTFATDTIEILGPKSSIENMQQQIAIDPSQKSQCSITQPIEFPNTSVYYKSSRVFRLWDFGDDVAPKCTSYLVPNTGWPQSGGWQYQAGLQQLNNSTGYWTMNGIKYPGKRLDCNFSLDTLPVHRYTDWDVIYQWYRYGHDFMPWDFTKYTRNPADTLPTANPKKIWVMPIDTLYWGKPVYLNPATGAFSLTQGTWTDPFSGLTQPWPRIDNISSASGPQDLVPYQKIQIKRGTPDPFALEQGEYNMLPKLLWVDPVAQPGGLSYQLPKTGKTYNYSYQQPLPRQSANKTLYRYIFDREVQKCLTVKLMHQDSANHASGNSWGTTDFLVLDSLDCNHETTVQLALTKPDARGLGKSGKECSGRFSQGGNGIRFHFDAINSALGDYPGVNPNCGQTFIMLNHDSLADRRDNTPCVLDGFVNWQGGTTAGGLIRPVFSNIADWSNPTQFWQAPTGASTWYHYGPNTILGGNTLTPASADGNVTVGLIVGSGNHTNICISDTIWYHNFLNFKPVNGQFFINPTVGANGVNSEACKLYKANDEINFMYKDSSQQRISYSAIIWGDNEITVDSFWYSPGTNNGTFINGVRRVRYELVSPPCGTSLSIKKTTPFPNGIPGVNLDTIWRENYRNRLYNPVSNPNGTMLILGPNPTNDSLLVTECAVNYTIAYKDTLTKWYKPEYQDRALMLLPVKHKFNSSSWDTDCKRADATPKPIFHVIENLSGCQAVETSNHLIVRGMIDTFKIVDRNNQVNTTFCVNEPVYFIDSVRYWRPDCALSDPIMNPNQLWDANGAPLGVLNAPWDAMHIDTTNYWRKNAGNPNTQWPNGSYIEKLIWHFGDGDSALGPNPVHQYKQSGAYQVKLFSRDKTGYWDTSVYLVNIIKNNIILTRPNPLNICYTSDLTPLPNFTTSTSENALWDYPAQRNILVQNQFNQRCIKPSLLTVKPTPQNPLKIWLHAYFYDGTCTILDSALVNIFALPIIDSIAGPKINIGTNTTYTYSVQQQLGMSYQWEILNGNITSGQGTNQINVQWLNIGKGELRVTLVNQQQCVNVANLSLTISNNNGIENIARNTSISIYPNPATHQIMIKDAETNLMGATITVLDLVGRKVKEIQIGESTYQNMIYIDDLAIGTYHLQIANKEKLANFKLIKN
ncbi:MAG: T9SS C-terminal target domain-containing protein [Bacteroidetes bacterium]|nr:MAG: T9SS C-terminal target domain-containing protein [Bacteroidota bacterium]